jgi:two-component system, NarL family, nitrate/nitrite response regulator NarL
MHQRRLIPSSNSKIAVLVGDGTAFMGGLIADSLRRDRELAIYETQGNSLLFAASTFKPDVILLGENLETAPSRQFAIFRELRKADLNSRIIMLLNSDHRDSVVQAFRSGARGVLSRNESLKTLNKCIHAVHDGQLWISDAHLEFLLEALASGKRTPLVNTQGARLLSEREEDVVSCLVKGLTNVQIAKELKLTENTIKNYLFRIFNKLGVSSRVELLVYAADKNHCVK